MGFRCRVCDDGGGRARSVYLVKRGPMPEDYPWPWYTLRVIEHRLAYCRNSRR